MNALALVLILWAQGIPVQPTQGGTITGILKDNQGQPVPRIRLAAVARVDPAVAPASTGAAMSSIAETDERGRYTLENIPPGHYYIAAGRLDRQTYYPGTPDIASAKEVLVTPGIRMEGIDFVLNNTSLGRAEISGFTTVLITPAEIPLSVSVEGGGKLPLSSAQGATVIRLNLIAGGNPATPGIAVAPLTSTSIPVLGPEASEYRVSIENLPNSYVVKSVMFGSIDARASTIKLVRENFPAGGSAFTVPGLPGVPVAAQQQVFSQLAANITGVNATNNAAATLAAKPISTLSITLGRVLPPATKGVRVSGQMGQNIAPSDLSRLAYISGSPGATFSDGSFEFRGVPTGRHLILLLQSAASQNPLAAAVAVGDRDVDGIALTAIPFVPANPRVPKPPEPLESYPPGSVVPFSRLIGAVREEVTKERIPEGNAKISNGVMTQTYPIGADGRFEISLFPGSYTLEIGIFGHSNLHESVKIEDRDVELNLTSKRLY